MFLGLTNGFNVHPLRFLVPCGGDGVLSVISAEGGQLASAGSVPTEKGARTGAIDPATGRIYLPTAQFQPAEAGPADHVAAAPEVLVRPHDLRAMDTEPLDI